jgi:hypothetical protein
MAMVTDAFLQVFFAKTPKSSGDKADLSCGKYILVALCGRWNT